MARSKRSQTTLEVVGVLFFALIALCVWGAVHHTSEPTSLANASSGHDIAGTVTLGIMADRESNSYDAGECVGGLGYDDIAPGSQVLLKDGDGHTLAVAYLGNGRIVSRATGSNFFTCQFSFTMSSVPDRPFYAFSLGHRSGPTYSQAEMTVSGWSAALTLGM